MSWLVRSLANSLNLEESNHSDEEDEKDLHEEGEESHPDTPSRGVKEDLSELSKTLTRQLWGVASFLAPPPQQSSVVDISPSDLSSFHGNDPDAFYYSAPKETDQEINDSETIAGIRSDFAEIGGKFRSGILKLSNAKAVSEITKIASSFLPFGSEEDFDENFTEREAIGVTDEVLAFARNISMHPETWLDFPLFTGDEDSDDFDMSNAQEEHILAIESLAPRLAALRIELCPSHMSEGCFWKIYFVLLHSRLNKHDAELLSTPQIVEARALWLQELQNRRKPELEKTIRDGDSSCFDEQLSSVPINDFETEKHPVTDLEMNVIDKSIIKEGPSSLDKKIETPSTYIHEYEQEDGDEWLQESGEMGISGVSVIPLGNEEDVSFSDLEEDDVSAPASSSKTLADASDGSSTVDSRGWVQLGKHSSIESTKTVEFPQSQADLELKESSDWLSLDETDV